MPWSVRVAVGGIIAGLSLGLAGCPKSSREAKVPTQTIELPKEGPKAAGAPSGGRPGPDAKKAAKAAD